MIAASIAYLIAVIAVILAEPLVVRFNEGAAFTRWLTEHVYLPMMRAAAVTVLLLAAYPAMFGLDGLPPLREVLDAGPIRVADLFNLMFILTLVLPLVVPHGPWQAAILPLQAALGASVLFAWAAAAAGIPASSLPPLAVMGQVLVIAGLGEGLARGAERLLRDGYPGWARLVTHDSIVLLFQLPALLLWTRALGG